MAIEVTKTKVNSSEISSEISIDFPIGLSESEKNDIKDKAGELIIDHILAQVGSAKSPIEGEKWPELSEEYKKHKVAEGRGGKANLEFHGDMLDALEFERTKSGVRIQIKGSEAPKADGHNNFSGESDLPRRKFLPEKGDIFTGSINDDIEGIVADAKAGSVNINKADLEDITTRFQLNEFLKETFVDISLTEIKSAILIDDDLRDLFSELLDLF